MWRRARESEAWRVREGRGEVGHVAAVSAVTQRCAAGNGGERCGHGRGRQLVSGAARAVRVGGEGKQLAHLQYWHRRELLRTSPSNTKRSSKVSMKESLLQMMTARERRSVASACIEMTNRTITKNTAICMSGNQHDEQEHHDAEAASLLMMLAFWSNMNTMSSRITLSRHRVSARRRIE